MLQRLLLALIESKNEAADELLLEALRVGNAAEQQVILDALVKRQAVRGLTGVIEQYDALPEALQRQVLANIKAFHTALRECGRSDDKALRLAAMKLIVLGRQGKLAYVLSDNLHNPDDALSKAACEAMVAMGRWVAVETRALQRGEKIEDRGSKIDDGAEDASRSSTLDARPSTFETTYAALVENRPEIEAAIARAMDVHRGKHGQNLLRAALLLCDWPGSKTLGILHTARHSGQSPLVRRLQQPPAAEHVEAFLLGGSHCQLRSHFGIAFSHIEEAPVLDALLRKTHWLKDHQLQLCVHQVTRGTWWGEKELLHDIERRPPCDAAGIAEWLAVSGMHDVMQDARMEQLRVHASTDFGARLRLLRIAASRKRGSSVQLIKSFLTDPDERIVRLAARELIRRRPQDYENTLLQLMTTAPESVRKVIGRAIGQVGFEHFWQRFDRMEKGTRQGAGRAMLKLLPDSMQRLSRKLTTGAPEQRVKAMQIVQELGLAEPLRGVLLPLCSHPHPRVRSKAVSVLADVPNAPDVLLDKVLHDADARVRANAIEVLETKLNESYVPLLTQRARSTHSRERANAIKALSKMKIETAAGQLASMLRDERGEHRISAMWALRHLGLWALLNEVARLAKSDTNVRVRRYALAMLKNVAEAAQARRAAAASENRSAAG
jgi:HEAT repeat protein